MGTDTQVEAHTLTVDTNDDVACSCKRLKITASLYGPRLATRLAHAHIANPALDVYDLLSFIVQRPL